MFAQEDMNERGGEWMDLKGKQSNKGNYFHPNPDNDAYVFVLDLHPKSRRIKPYICLFDYSVA